MPPAEIARHRQAAHLVQYPARGGVDILGAAGHANGREFVAPVTGHHVVRSQLALQATGHHVQDRVARLAGALQGLGVAGDEPVAILAHNSDRYFEALFGTLFPLIMDALGQGKYSVGPPYFNAVFVPLMALLAPFMGIAPISRWKRDSSQRWNGHR